MFFRPFRLNKQKIGGDTMSSSGSGGLKRLVGGAIISVFVILLAQLYWPGTIPFDPFRFWRNNEVLGGVMASWPIFFWGTGVTILFAAIVHYKLAKRSDDDKFVERFVRSFNTDSLADTAGGILFTSIRAGILEELLFRWLFFVAAIVIAKVMNYLVFGCLGFGVGEWLYGNLFAPVISFLTIGKMDWLLYGMGWAVGAAATSANASFRNEHLYLGLFGWLNSWIIGFFLFWVMFNFGLMASITVHFLYDLIVLSISVAGHELSQRKRLSAY